jgi:hypothetical protein
MIQLACRSCFSEETGGCARQSAALTEAGADARPAPGRRMSASARPGTGQAAPGPRRGCPATSQARHTVNPAMVYLPGGTYATVRKHDLLAVPAALRDVAAGACVPDPGLRQNARLAEAVLRLSAAAAG